MSTVHFHAPLVDHAVNLSHAAMAFFIHSSVAIAASVDKPFASVHSRTLTRCPHGAHLQCPTDSRMGQPEFRPVRLGQCVCDLVDRLMKVLSLDSVEPASISSGWKREVGRGVGAIAGSRGLSLALGRVFPPVADADANAGGSGDLPRLRGEGSSKGMPLAVFSRFMSSSISNAG